MQGQQDLFDGKPRQLIPGTDITARYHRGAETSVEAFKSTPTSTRKAQAARILRFIAERQQNGATCEEVEIALQLSHQTASARISELSAEHHIHHGTDRRKTSHGKSARVYRAGAGALKGETA